MIVYTNILSNDLILYFQKNNIIISDELNENIDSILIDNIDIIDDYILSIKNDKRITLIYYGDEIDIFNPFLAAFDYIFTKNLDNYNTLKEIFSVDYTFYNETYEFLINVLKKCTLRPSPPQYISDYDKDKSIENTLINVLKLLDLYNSKNLIYLKNNYALSRLLYTRKQPSSGYIEKSITEQILWDITEDPYAPYYYGLVEVVLNAGLQKKIRWIIEDYYKNYKYISFNNKDNIKIVNKNFQELHRSGWQYIVNNIIKELSVEKKLIVDTYVDKTFHWNMDFYIKKGLLPYNERWVGFIHHTFSYYNNFYNCDVLFNNPIFLQSLTHCECLIVMTEYLKQQILNILDNIGIQVDVFVVYHPSIDVDVNDMFTIDKFVNNNNKQLVHVGNWLRNVHSIYEIELPTNSVVNKKMVLKNKNADNYIPPENFINDLYTSLNYKPITTTVLDICKISFENIYVKGVYEFLYKLFNSVGYIEYLNNNEYDVLFSKNIIFVKLVDASAINTLIECILRNTPIIINRIDPVVEMIGKDYPLLYTHNYEVSVFLSDIKYINNAYNYLKSMDKTKYKIETFNQKMRDILSDIKK